MFIPSHSLAIEYHGQQHFKPVGRFGGEEAFAKNKMRDDLKRKACRKNGINLIVFRFDETLTTEFVRKKLKKYIDG